MLQDQQYTRVGASIVKTVEVFQADIVLKVQPPDLESEVERFRTGQTLFSMVQAQTNESLLARLQEKDMTLIGVLSSVVLLCPSQPKG